MEKGVRLSVLLWEMVSEKEYPNILYHLTDKYGWDSSDLVTENNIKRLKTDIEQARGVISREEIISYDDDDSYYDDEEDEEISFYCSNSEGEGQVTFIQEDGYWKEHWTDWEDYEEGSDSKPRAMRYMSYLTKSDLRQYLYRDGFDNVTEIE